MLGRPRDETGYGRQVGGWKTFRADSEWLCGGYFVIQAPCFFLGRPAPGRAPPVFGRFPPRFWASFCA